MRYSPVSFLTLCFCLCLAGGAAAQITNLGFDPVREDPTVVDREFPPSTVELSIDNQGEKLHGLMYLAQGKGPHPTLILLHGFPGFEQNLDLAQSLRRAGFNILAFHYRGSWGSDGVFSLTNARDDVDAAVRYLRNRETAEANRVDPAYIGVVGYSMGGFLALQAAALDQFIGCIAALAPANMGVMAEAARNDPDYRATIAEDSGDFGPINGINGEGLLEELEAHPEFDVTTLADKLAPRPLLLIGGTNDTVLPTAVFHDPIAVAYQSLEWPELEVLLMDGDHSFSWNRIALTRKVTDWAMRSCAAEQEDETE